MELVTDANTLRNWINQQQLRVMGDLTRGEEGEHFIEMFNKWAQVVREMPGPMEQDGKGEAAVAHLHYFTAAADWWILERDEDPEREQWQAFGLARIFEAELGYIPIPELLNAGAELDLYWTPKPLCEVKRDAGEPYDRELYNKLTA